MMLKTLQKESETLSPGEGVVGAKIQSLKPFERMRRSRHFSKAAARRLALSLALILVYLLIQSNLLVTSSSLTLLYEEYSGGGSEQAQKADKEDKEDLVEYLLRLADPNIGQDLRDSMKSNTTSSTRKTKKKPKGLVDPSISYPYPPNSNSSFIVLRAIGNALPPRHLPEQTIQSLKFILEHEEIHKLSTVSRHWVVNRLVDKEVEDQVLSLLQQHKENYTVIPFEIEEYAKLPYNYSIEFPYMLWTPDRTLDVIHSREFILGPTKKVMKGAVKKNEISLIEAAIDEAARRRNEYMETVQGPRMLYASNQNAARNTMIDIGKDSGAEWVLPLDGNCIFTPAAWGKLVADIDNLSGKEDKNQTKASKRFSNIYYLLPMTRITGKNEALLSPDFVPYATEEPQLVFHRSAQARFDPRLRYGRRNKVGLLIQLGVNGAWNKWPWLDWEKDEQPVRRDPKISDKHPREKLADVGWVARLSSGVGYLEEDGRGPARTASRSDAMKILLRKLDHRVLVDVQGWSQKTLMYYDEMTLTQEREIYQSSCVGRAGEVPPVCNTIAALVQLASQNLNQGPWSVTDKPWLWPWTSVAPSGDPHDYYNPAPYYWPPPWWNRSGKFTRKDGVRRPETQMYGSGSNQFDRSRLQSMLNNVTVWSLSSYFTDDQRYAEKAVEAVDTWFINPVTRMNPHLRWAQVVGSEKGKGQGIIETRDFYFLLDAIRLLQWKEAFSPAQSESLQQWFSDFLEYLLSDEQGLFANMKDNNHGIYYDVQVTAIAAFVDNATVLSDAVHRSTSRLWAQIAPDGSMPHELKRPICEHYQVFTLSGLQILSRIADKVGVDLWKAPARLGTGDRKESSILCKALWKANPYLTRRNVCDGNIADIDERRWWPLNFSSKRCPAWLLQNRSLSEWLEIPTPRMSIYEMPSIFFGHDGIGPFWNLGNPDQ